MQALHDLVKSGKVRYIGASSMWAYQFATLQQIAERNGWTKFVSMQNHYNLIYREEEREMIKFCKETGVGLIPVKVALISLIFVLSLTMLVESLRRWQARTSNKSKWSDSSLHGVS